MPATTTSRSDRGGSGRQDLTTLPFDSGDPQSPPYRHAVIIEFSTSAHGNISPGYAKTAMRMGSSVSVLIVRDGIRTSKSPQLRIEKYIRENGLQEDISVEILDSLCEAERYLETRAEIDLVVADRTYYGRLDDWNARRKKMGFAGYDVLCGRSGSAYRTATGSDSSARAFRLASAGGTFNALHDGHRKYIISAVRLADDVHIFIADDTYAKVRKAYNPRSLARRRRALKSYVRKLRCGQRVAIETLRCVDDIERYVRSAAELDVVITESHYFEWFDRWNDLRKRDGLEHYSILCRERTMILGTDLTSSMLAEMEGVENDTDMMQCRLF